MRRPGPVVWMLIVILWSLGTAGAVYGDTHPAVRAVVAVPFVVACPGLSLARFIRLRDALGELTLGVALSLSLAVLVPATLLYAHAWSPNAALGILTGVAVFSAVLDVLRPLSGPPAGEAPG